MSRYKILALLTLAQIGASVIQQGFGVLAPFLIADFALSKSAFGVLFSAMVLGTAMFAAFAGALSDRFGERRVLGFSAVLMTFALLLAAAVENYVWLMVTMLLFGITYSAQPSAGTRAVMAWFTRDRAFAMSVRQTGVPLGGMIGALLLPFVALHFGGYRSALVFAAGVVLLPSIAMLSWYREPSTARPRTASGSGGLLRSLAVLMRDGRIVGLSVSAIGLTGLQQSMASFLALTESGVFGVSTTGAAAAFACAQGAAVFGRLFWSWLSDRFLRGDRYLLVALLSVAAAATAIALGTLRHTELPLGIAIAAIMGLTAAGWNGVFLTATAEIGGKEGAGTVVGALSTVIFAASALTPAVFGLIAQRSSIAVAWYTFAFVGLVGAVPPILLFARKMTPRNAA